MASDYSELELDSKICILSLLNTKDAHRACLASKSWENLWKDLRKLDFQSDECDMEKLGRFVEWINRRILSFYSERLLDEFKVRYPYGSDFLNVDMDSWIEFILDRKIASVSIDCGRDTSIFRSTNGMNAGRSYILPLKFYSHSQLQILSLANCDMRNLSSAGQHTFLTKVHGMAVIVVEPVKWTCLQKLSLDYVVNFTDELLQSILQGCPVLVFLSLTGCRGFTTLNLSHNMLREVEIIDMGPVIIPGYIMDLEEEGPADHLLDIFAPNIKSLTIEVGNHPNFFERPGMDYAMFRLVDVHSLERARMQDTYPSSTSLSKYPRCTYSTNDQIRRAMESYLTGLSHVSDQLIIGVEAVEILSGSLARGWVDAPMLACRSLVLSVTQRLSHMQVLMWLLNSCPNIQTVDIDVRYDEPEKPLLTLEEAIERLIDKEEPDEEQAIEQAIKRLLDGEEPYEPDEVAPVQIDFDNIIHLKTATLTSSAQESCVRVLLSITQSLLMRAINLEKIFIRSEGDLEEVIGSYPRSSNNVSFKF